MAARCHVGYPRKPKITLHLKVEVCVKFSLSWSEKLSILCSLFLILYSLFSVLCSLSSVLYTGCSFDDDCNKSLDTAVYIHMIIFSQLNLESMSTLCSLDPKMSQESEQFPFLHTDSTERQRWLAQQEDSTLQLWEFQQKEYTEIHLHNWMKQKS